MEHIEPDDAESSRRQTERNSESVVLSGGFLTPVTCNDFLALAVESSDAQVVRFTL